MASRDVYSSLKAEAWHYICSKDVDITCNELIPWAMWKSNAAADTAVLVFRGTHLSESLQDILHNISVQTVRLKGTRSAHVHSGFNAAVENVFDDITAALRASGVKNFNVTGHSLGGALAQLFALKYMLQHPQPAESATLKRVITFGAPMTLWCLGEELHAEDAQYLHPWMDVCVNYIHRADPVPMTPRLLSCRYIWNTFLDMIESQVPLLGFVNPSYFMNLRISSRGEPPALFSTLSFACGYRPPGVTVMLLGDAAPMILNPRAMQKLATTFDTIVCFKDKFSHHKMAGYISAVERASDQMCSVDVDNDQNEFEFNDEPLSTAEGEIVCSVPPIPSRPSPSTDRYKL
ncbi:PLIP1 [Symbiodinium microadriaticum]|nr:PLIP1 [Symbiodinium microadriaticum]